MNRRHFIVLAMLAPLSACVPFRIGWRQGGLCSSEASDVEVDYRENSMRLIDILKIGRITAETNYIDAKKRGFEPRPGAIESNALDEAKSFVKFLYSGGYKVTDSDKDISLYVAELCQRSCLTQQADCKLNKDNLEKLKSLIEYAKNE